MGEGDSSKDFTLGLHGVPSLWVVIPLILGFAAAPHAKTALFLSAASLAVAFLFRKTFLIFFIILPLAVLYRNSFDRKDLFWDRFVGKRVIARLELKSDRSCKVVEILTDSGFEPISMRIGYSGPIFPEGTKMTVEGFVSESNRWLYQSTGLRYMLNCERVMSIRPAVGRRVMVREAIRSLLRESAWDSVNSSMMAAFLLGDRYGVPFEIRENFRRCGVYHLFAISGLHIGLLFTVLLAIALSFRMPKRGAVAVSSIIMGLYGYLVGFSPSILRSILMLWSFTFALLVSKKTVLLNVLAFSALLSLVLRPYYIENLGFQLSYLATFGILLYSPVFIAIKLKRFQWLIAALLVSLSASAFTSPLVSNKFGYISLVSPLSSVLLSLLLWVVLAETVAFLLTGFRPFASVANASLILMRHSVNSISKIPFAAIDIKISDAALVLWLASVILLGFALRMKVTGKLMG